MTKEEKDRALALARSGKALREESGAECPADPKRETVAHANNWPTLYNAEVLLSVEPNPPGERQRQGEAWVKKLAEEET